MRKLLLCLCAAVACWMSDVGATCPNQHIEFWRDWDGKYAERRLHDYNHFPNLTKLAIERVDIADNDNIFEVKRFPRLRELYIHGSARKFSDTNELANRYNFLYGNSTLPSSITRLNQLETLTIDEVYFPTLPDWFGNLRNLRHLYINYREFRLSDTIGNLDNLRSLKLSCAGENLPDSIGNIISLKSLEINETGTPWLFWNQRTGWSFTRPSLHLRHIPSSIGNLQNLEHLSFRGCTELTSLPDSIGNLINLRSLDLRGCTGLRKLPDFITRGMPNLRDLRVDERLLENGNVGDDFLSERILNLILARRNAARWNGEQLEDAISLKGHRLFRR